MKIQLETEILLAANKATTTPKKNNSSIELANILLEHTNFHVKLMKKTCFTSNYAHIVDLQQFPHFPPVLSSKTSPHTVLILQEKWWRNTWQHITYTAHPFTIYNLLKWEIWRHIRVWIHVLYHSPINFFDNQWQRLNRSFSVEDWWHIDWAYCRSICDCVKYIGFTGTFIFWISTYYSFD